MKTSDNYYTPDFLIKKEREVMGSIELDPCSSELANKTVQADRIYTLENSMFRNPLNCKTMHFNPPYSSPVPFVERVVYEFQQGNISQLIGIFNTDNSTRWFAEIRKIATAYCFLSDRVQFIDATNDKLVQMSSNPKPQFMFYAGNNTDKFVQEFKGLGLTVRNTEH
jgi:hypothetical protein